MNPRLSDDPRLPPVDAGAITAEQVNLLYGAAVVPLFNLLTAPIAAALLHPLFPTWVLLCWLALVCAVVAGRLLLSRSFHRTAPADRNAERWGRAFASGAFFTGCLWGLLGFVVLVTDDPAFYVFVAFILAGMTAGAAMRDSPYIPALYAFIVPAVTPMIIAFLAKGTLMSAGMGLLLLTFAIVLVLMGHENYHRIIENIRMRIEQTTLNGDLQRMTRALTGEIAESKGVAIALEESSERFRAIGDRAQDSIIITDSANAVVYWNPAAERTFGYTPEEMIGRSAHEVLTPTRYRGAAIAGYRHFAVTGQGPVVNQTLPFAAIRKDGSEFPIELSVSAMRIGGTWHSLGIARDVTTRDLTETALRERGAELKEAQRLAHVGSWVWQEDTDMLEWSEELYRLFGRDPAQPAPSLEEHAQFLTPASFLRLRNAMTVCQAQGAPYEIDLEGKRANGRVIWVSMRGELQKSANGGLARIRGTAQDITERKSAELRSQEAEAMLRALVEQGMSGIVIVAEDTTLAYINPRFAQMIGLEAPAEAIGRSITDFAAEADRPAIGAAIESLFSGRDASRELALTLVDRHGGVVNVLAQGSLATFEGKRAIIAVVMDITERQQAEEKIAILNAQMIASVAVLERRARDQSAIARLSDILQTCHARLEAYPIIAATAGCLFPGASGGLAQVSAKSRELETVAQWGAHPLAAPRFFFDDCWALRTGRRYEVDDPVGGILCSHFTAAPDGPYLCLPLTVHGETGGSMHLQLAAGAHLDDELRQLLLTFGDVVKLSLSNLKLRESLREQAVRDALTGLFNRHYLAETLPREVNQAQRSGAPLTVAMMDIDHFKAFNDAEGHDAGDAVLRGIGAMLQDQMRKGDIACRYGGEELLLVLPNCDAADAKARLEQICLEIKHRTFVIRGRAMLSVTMSVGLAQLSDAICSPDALITSADEALYAAKRGGRDRIETFAGDMHPVPQVLSA